MPATTEPALLELPRINGWQLRLFTRYIAFYMRRHLHGVHLAGQRSLDSIAGLPLLICVNHPGWWDPLLAIYLSRRFMADRSNYGPIASKGLEKYRFFERLGFFGIDPESRSGAHKFLQIGAAVMARGDTALWVSAQGQFTDVRQRPVTLQGGVGHVARRAPGQFAFLPLAFEYSFWEERTAEAFISIGRPDVIEDGRERSSAEWTTYFAARLEATQDELSGLVQRRQQEAFVPLLTGAAGVGGVYDLWRASKAWARGKRFQAEHGRKAS